MFLLLLKINDFQRKDEDLYLKMLNTAVKCSFSVVVKNIKNILRNLSEAKIFDILLFFILRNKKLQTSQLLYR